MCNKLFFFFLFLISSSSILNQDTNTIMKFFNKILTSDNTDGEENTCLCDIDRKACNYLCCCDQKCNETSIDFWKKRSKCIDEKDTVGIFADRCIDKNLVVEFTKKEKEKKYRRRGLEKITATEDISNSNETLENYCFSMDNSSPMKQEIKPMNLDTEKLKSASSEENGNSQNEGTNEASSRLSYRYLSINENNNSNKANNTLRANDEQDNNINIYNSINTFINDGNFSLYSGTICGNNAKVERMKNVNYSCLMTNEDNEKIKNILKQPNNIEIGGASCSIEGVYRITNGLLSSESNSSNKNINDNEIILEIEFILQMQDYEGNLNNCSINIVTKKKEENESNFIFKNSVIFTNNSRVPYRYSGINGYLNGYPLKVYIDSYVFNEFYIVGREENGNCRKDDNLYDYLYFSDKPILFNQNYSYSCNLTEGTQLNETTLFKKLNQIKKIASYGNSHYKKINGKNKNGKFFWKDIDKKYLDPNNTNNTLIKMNIYLGTRKIGVYSYKYIYKVVLKNIFQDKNGTLSLDINFYDLDKKQVFEQTPELPAFIPSMPGDLLDPLIY